MLPKLSLAGLNTLRLAIAVASGAMAFGISVVGRSTGSASAMVDGTLLTALWIYVGVTAVPWASLKGMPGSGVMPALTMAGFGAYLAAAAAFAGWTVADNPVWHEPPRATAPPRCVPDPAAAPAANRPAPPTPVAAAPAPVLPAPVVAPPDAPVRAPEAPPADASVGQASPSDASVEEPEGRRRRSRRHRGDEESDDSRPPPAVWLERDPATSSAPNN